VASPDGGEFHLVSDLRVHRLLVNNIKWTPKLDVAFEKISRSAHFLQDLCFQPRKRLDLGKMIAARIMQRSGK
jgi:hypothetical protein